MTPIRLTTPVVVLSGWWPDGDEVVIPATPLNEVLWHHKGFIAPAEARRIVSDLSEDGFSLIGSRDDRPQIVVLAELRAMVERAR